jgi:hypothetical protein
MSGTFKLRVALTPSPNQGIHCVSLDATKGDMVFKGEKIMILDVQGECSSQSTKAVKALLLLVLFGITQIKRAGASNF